MGGRRLVTQISEVQPLGTDGQYQLKDIFNLKKAGHADDGKNVQLTWTGERSYLAGSLRPAEQAKVTELTEAIFTEEPTEA